MHVNYLEFDGMETVVNGLKQLKAQGWETLI